MKKVYITILIVIGLCIQTNAQVPIPADSQSEPILLRGAFAHLGNGEIIENSLIGFDNGKLTIVADASSAFNSEGYREVDVTGKHVYPGFILPNSQIGLTEVNAIRAMRDYDETGEFNPNVRSLVAYNTDSEYIPTFRFNGVLLAESTPTGGRISGTSSFMEMEGWNWEDAVHTPDIGIHVNFPRQMNRRFDFSTFTVSTEENKKYREQVEELGQMLDDAIAYHKSSGKKANIKLEALKGILDGSQTLFLHTNEPKEIIEAVRLAQSKEIPRIVVVTGDAALKVSQFLLDNEISIILSTSQRIPERPDDEVWGPYKLPFLLQEKGLLFAMDADAVREGINLPFAAGTAIAYGMDPEEAVKMITLNAARILGVDERVGSLEVGKDATLFVSEGDALDYRTNNLTHAFISGKEVILDNKQQALYKRYSDKYGHSE